MTINFRRGNSREIIPGKKDTQELKVDEFKGANCEL